MLRLGAEKLEIHREKDCPHCAVSRRLQDRSRARQWLAQFATDSAVLTALRRHLSEETSSFGVSGMSDSEVIDALVELLSNGLFHVHASAYVDSGKSNAPASSDANAAREVPFPISERRSRSSSSAAAVSIVDQLTFATSLDAGVQAAALVAASEEGVPFCEQCEKAGAAAAAQGQS